MKLLKFSLILFLVIGCVPVYGKGGCCIKTSNYAGAAAGSTIWGDGIAGSRLDAEAKETISCGVKQRANANVCEGVAACGAFELDGVAEAGNKYERCCSKKTNSAIAGGEGGLLGGAGVALAHYEVKATQNIDCCGSTQKANAEADNLLAGGAMLMGHSSGIGIEQKSKGCGKCKPNATQNVDGMIEQGASGGALLVGHLDGSASLKTGKWGPTTMNASASATTLSISTGFATNYSIVTVQNKTK